MDRQLRAVRTADRGAVTFGAEPVFGGYLLPRVVSGFQSLHPGIAVAAGIDLSRRLIEEVRERRLDLAVIVGNFNRPGIQIGPLRGYDVVCVARAGRYPGTRLSLAALRGEPWILPKAGFILRERIGELTDRAGVSLNATLELDSPEARLRAAMEGFGIAPIADQMAADGLASGLMDRLDVEGFPLRIDWHLIWRPDDLSPASRAYRDYLLAVSQQWEAEEAARLDALPAEEQARMRPNV
jgi:DNA-binding transcriptional LysR family regulator